MTPPVLICNVGDRYGRYTILADPRPGSKAHCRCDCGAERWVYRSALVHGRVMSCGCYHRERVTKHGLSRTRAYSTWTGMRGRTSDPKNLSWPDYGGRGITMCERWQTFENFYADMGEPPRGLSIDRINNDGNYEPDNCRWATPSEQCYNRRPFRKRDRCLLAGHKLTPENTYRGARGRGCRACRNLSRRIRRLVGLVPGLTPDVTRGVLSGRGFEVAVDQVAEMYAESPEETSRAVDHLAMATLDLMAGGHDAPVQLAQRAVAASAAAGHVSDEGMFR